MNGLECAYCGSENIWLEKINISKENPSLVDAHVHCSDCNREDIAGCRTDYLIWFLYKLLPTLPAKLKNRTLRIQRANEEPDGAA